jgi:Asp-tRNA(Asn)/Glu-tRNA(Gln) amidotransferase A subunit family amidase
VQRQGSCLVNGLKLRLFQVRRIISAWLVQVRTLVQREMYAALAEHDALISPAAPTAAYRIGQVNSDPLEMYKGDLMTVNLNLAGEA